MEMTAPFLPGDERRSPDPASPVVLDGRTFQALLDLVRREPPVPGAPEGYQVEAVLQWVCWWPKDSALDVARWLAHPKDPSCEPGEWDAVNWREHYAGLAAADAADGPDGLWVLGTDGMTQHVLVAVPGEGGAARTVCGKTGVPFRLLLHRFSPCRSCMRALAAKGHKVARGAVSE